MLVETQRGTVRVAVTLPTRRRVEELAATLEVMPFLLSEDTFVGVDEREWDDYAPVRARYTPLTWVRYRNEPPSLGFCREQLKEVALSNRGRYAYVFITDDIKRIKHDDAVRLVRCAHEFPKQPCVVHAIHEAAEFYLRDTVPDDLQTVNGISSFEGVSACPSVIPVSLYQDFHYPDDVGAAEDWYHMCWLLSRGYLNIRICLDARCSARRHSPGGWLTSDPNEKLINVGRAYARLGADFPLFVGAEAQVRLAWKYIFALAKGHRYTEFPRAGRSNMTEVLSGLTPVEVYPPPTQGARYGKHVEEAPAARRRGRNRSHRG